MLGTRLSHSRGTIMDRGFTALQACAGSLLLTIFLGGFYLRTWSEVFMLFAALAVIIYFSILTTE
jgi:hypothetical protein